MLQRVSLALAVASVVAGQNSSAIQVITPNDVAFLSFNTTAHDSSIGFQVWDQSFEQILGSDPTLTLVLNESEPYFHEAGVWYSNNPPTIICTSNQFNTTSPSAATNNKQIVVSVVTQSNSTGQWSSAVVTPDPAIALVNGGFGYQTGVLFAAQGSLDAPSGLIYMNVEGNSSMSSYPTTTLIDNFLGREFNSPNDIHISSNGDIYFTDPVIGFVQDIRPAPQLPAHVYVYRPNTTQIRVLVEDIAVPNGIVLSPDEKTAYVTTTPLDNNTQDPRTIYAYDIVTDGTQGGVPSFQNKRIFAFVNVGAADGIKTDTNGNVYAGCGDGINVWNPAGVLIGKIGMGGTVANFAFGPNGQIAVFFEKQLYIAQLNSTLQPAVSPVVM